MERSFFIFTVMIKAIAYSWDGAFNTKTKNKTHAVTVKLGFEIK